MRLLTTAQIVTSSNMSPTQIVSQISLPMETSVPSPPEVPDESVWLCDTCREAHHAALRDDNPPWVHCYDYVQFGPDGVSRTSRLPADLWPDLPRLFESAQSGCAFCAFLREAILSDKFNDAWENSTNGSITKADRKLVEFEFHYGRKAANPPSPLVCLFAMRYLIVRVTFEESLTVLLYFQLEAITGKHASLMCRLTYISLTTSVFMPQTIRPSRNGLFLGLQLYGITTTTRLPHS